MSTPERRARTLLEKIQSLPAERIAEVEDFVDFLRERVHITKPPSSEALDFPVDDLGPWPQDLSMRREDMYGDDER